MTEHIVIGLASIIALGIFAQWAAWRLKLPSILFLLIFGFVAGPVTGFLKPDAIFGDLLMPIVSISVAMILFEGGLTLRFFELKETGRVVRNMITIGALATWLMIAALSYYLLNFHLALAILFGAILVVTGPTVIGPLLRHIRPLGRVGSIVKWEGIIIDPFGALLAVLVFEAALVGKLADAGQLIALSLVKTLVFGFVAAGLGAWLLIVFIKRHWVPDFLQEEVTLMAVVVVFVLANFFQEESGLFAVTVMGITLANQKSISIKQILEFKENLRVLIVSSLFILLAARLQLDELLYINANSLIFLAALIFLVRPIAVALSTLGSDLSWKERIFVAWMAPRGIVAAAISAVFAVRLFEQGFSQSEHLVPLTFMVIIGTVGFYGLTAAPVARWLGLSESNPQGILIVGSHAWARSIAKAVQDEGFNVLLVDTNRHNEYLARMQGLNTHHGSVLSERIHQEIALDGLGKLLALTSNDEANSLGALNFLEYFNRKEVYQLLPEDLKSEEHDEFSPMHLRARFLFSEEANFDTLTKRFAAGAVVKTCTLSETFDYQAFQELYGETAIVLFRITEDRQLIVRTTDSEMGPEAGDTLIALVDEAE